MLIALWSVDPARRLRIHHGAAHVHMAGLWPCSRLAAQRINIAHELFSRPRVGATRIVCKQAVLTQHSRHCIRKLRCPRAREVLPLLVAAIERRAAP